MSLCLYLLFIINVIHGTNIVPNAGIRYWEASEHTDGNFAFQKGLGSQNYNKNMQQVTVDNDASKFMNGSTSSSGRIIM